MKSIFESKTVWIAIIQAVVGGLVIFFTEIPDLVGYVAVVKSVGDILIRLITDKPIRSS